MARQIFLIRYPAYPFKDHWGLWIPSAANNQIGTVINVEGDVRNGFRQEIERNYDLRVTQRSKRFTLLGQVQDEHVHDTPSSGAPINDTVARDNVERNALSIAAPGPSMNPTTGDTPPAQRVNFSDCQWWVSQVVAKLVQENILDASANATLQTTPRN